MTQQNATPNKTAGHAIFMILSLLALGGTAWYLNAENNENSKAYKEKVIQITKEDVDFIKKNDCWLTKSQIEHNTSKTETKFFKPKTDSKYFLYRCPENHYQSNVYIGPHDLAHLSEAEKNVVLKRIVKNKD